MSRPAETPAERQARRERACYEWIGRGFVVVCALLLIAAAIRAFAAGMESVPWAK